MSHQEWNDILEEINHDQSLSGKNIIEKIKKKLQASYPTEYKEWEKENFSLDYPFSFLYNMEGEVYKSTLLHFAAKNGYIKVVEALLKAKGDVNILDDQHYTPLHYASWHDHGEVVKILLNKRADANGWVYILWNKHTKNKNTPLSLATQYGHKEIMRDLLAAKADPNARNRGHKKTPLHIAAEVNDEEAVRLLLKEGGDPFLRSGVFCEVTLLDCNKTPRELAKNEKVKKLLEEAEQKQLIKNAIFKGIVAGVGTGLLGGTIAIALFVSDVIKVEPLPISAAAVIVVLAVFAAVCITCIVSKPDTEMKGQNNVDQHAQGDKQNKTCGSLN